MISAKVRSDKGKTGEIENELLSTRGFWANRPHLAYCCGRGIDQKTLIRIEVERYSPQNDAALIALNRHRRESPAGDFALDRGILGSLHCNRNVVAVGYEHLFWCIHNHGP